MKKILLIGLLFIMPFMLSGITIIRGQVQDNLSAIVAPAGATDDESLGYSVGSMWIDTVLDNIYVCTDATNGAANWEDLLGAAGGGYVEIDGSTPMTGMLEWSAGSAVTAGDYSIGRDADGTNQLHLNYPTGASMEISIQDAATLTVGASGNIDSMLIANIAAGDAHDITGVVGTGELTLGAPGTQNFLDITPFINQSVTAGYTALNVNVTETATGSGVKRLIDLAVAGTGTRFAVASAGGITSNLGATSSVDVVATTTRTSTDPVINLDATIDTTDPAANVSVIDIDATRGVDTTGIDKVLDISFTPSRTTGSTSYGADIAVTSSAVVTDTADNYVGLRATATKTGNDSNAAETDVIAISANANNTGTVGGATVKKTYGIKTSVIGDSGGESTCFGGYFSASTCDYNYGISASGTNSYGLYASSTNGIGVLGTTGANVAMSGLNYSASYPTARFNNNTSVNNTSIEILRIMRSTSHASNGASGIGGSIDFYNEDDGGTSELSGRIGNVLTNAGAATEASKLSFWTRTGGAAIAERVIIDEHGQIQQQRKQWNDDVYGAIKAEWADRTVTGSRAVQNATGGWYRMTTGATATNEESIDWNDICPFINTRQPTFIIGIDLEEINDSEVDFGWIEASGGGVDDYIKISLDPSASANWILSAANNGGGAASTDASADAAVDTETWFKIIFNADTDIEWFISTDQGLTWTSQGVITEDTDIPTVQLQPFISIKTEADDDKYMDWTSVQLSEDRN